jgi:hypothetical protein
VHPNAPQLINYGNLVSKATRQPTLDTGHERVL